MQNLIEGKERLLWSDAREFSRIMSRKKLSQEDADEAQRILLRWKKTPEKLFEIARRIPFTEPVRYSFSKPVFYLFMSRDVE